jgi:hypothetical protein
MKHVLLFFFLLLMHCLPAQVVVRSFGNGEFIGRDYQWSMILDWHDLPPTYFYTVQYVTADSGAFGAYDAIIMDVNGGPHQVLVDTAFPHMAKLFSVGDTVGPNSGNWATNPDNPLWGSIRYEGSNYPSYNTQPFDCKYVCLRYASFSETYYAWLSVESDTIGARKLKLKGYTFQATNGVPVLIDENCTFVGSNEEAAPMDVSISPNPFREELWIDLGELKGKVTVELYDVVGHLRYAETALGNSELRCDMRLYQASTYFIVIQNAGNRIVRRVVRQ